MHDDYKISVDSDRCIQCRLCAIECPSGTASFDEIRSNQASSFCDKCFHCYAICPENAIRIEGFGEELVAGNLQIDYFRFLHFLKKRRSIRKFIQEPIPDQLLKQLADTAKYSPTGGNVQEFSITIINSLDTRNELEKDIMKYYDRIIRLLRLPLVNVFMKLFGDAKVKETAGDKEFFSKIEDIYSRMKAGEKNIFYDAPAVMLFHTSRVLPTALEDCILAAYNVVLAAISLGLGSCFVSLSQQAVSSSPAIKNRLGIPHSDQVYAVLVLGFPAVKYRRVTPRKEKNIVYI